MRRSNKVHRLTQMAILVAIIFLLAFTPLGYLTIGPIAANTVQMTVIIGAVLMGPTAGLILGFFFGLSALIKVLTMPGADAFAYAILTYSPVAYLVICVVARVLMGFLAGLLGAALKKVAENKSVVRYGVTGFVGSLLNTVFYLGFLWMLAAEVVANAYGVALSEVGGIVLTTAAAAGLPEAVVSAVVVTAVCKALERVFR